MPTRVEDGELFLVDESKQITESERDTSSGYRTQPLRLCCKNDGIMVSSALFETRRGVPFMNNQSPFKWRHFDHFAVRTVVLALLSELSRSRRDDAGTGIAGRSHDDLSLGPALHSGTGKTMPTSFESHDRLLESRRNVYQSPHNLDVSVSSS